jgi:ribonuclease J
VIWSMWDGYWERDRYVRPFCEKHGITRTKLHTSGHASLADLQRIAEGLKPESVVPIHTERADDYAQYFANVRVLADGEVLGI